MCRESRANLWKAESRASKKNDRKTINAARKQKQGGGVQKKSGGAKERGSWEGKEVAGRFQRGKDCARLVISSRKGGKERNSKGGTRGEISPKKHIFPKTKGNPRRVGPRRGDWGPIGKGKEEVQGELDA